LGTQTGHESSRTGPKYIQLPLRRSEIRVLSCTCSSFQAFQSYYTQVSSLLY